MNHDKHGIEGCVWIAPMTGDFELDAMCFTESEKDFLTAPGKAQPQQLDIIIKGKRIWWKPWRRRPDKTWHFPAVSIADNGDGTISFNVESRWDQ